MRGKMRLTIKCLLENKLRFFLTVLSISVAVTSVLLIKAISGFGVKAVWSELDSLGMNGLIVSSDTAQLREREVEQIGDIAGVSTAAPVTLDASKAFIGSQSTNAMIWGIDERAENVISFELIYGRFIDRGDIKAKSRVCMVDQSLAVQLCGSENAVGKTVELLCDGAVKSFFVVGVVKTGKGIMQSLMGSYFPAFMYAPYTAFHAEPNFTQIFVKTNGAIPSNNIGELIKNEFSDEVSVADLAGQKGALENMLFVVTTILTVIGSISLLVSGISIMNVMLISVGERTKEIGIKMSIGASKGDIMLDFLFESVIIAFVGTAIGILFSVIICFVSSVITGEDISVSYSSMLTAALTAAVLGMTFGIFPAYKASRFKPVEALRR